MIPTVIWVAALIAMVVPRWAVLAIPALGGAWGLLMLTTNDADFLGAFAFGTLNAAIGASFGLLVVAVSRFFGWVWGHMKPGRSS
jgi:hypothetical protein